MSDPFSDARDAFVKSEDLLGRLLLISPTDVGERTSNLPGSNGKTYEYVVCDTVVLDGEVDELIDEVPAVLEDFQFSGASIVPQLKPKIRTQGMVLGRLTKRPSQTKGFGDAWVLAAPEDKDKAVARKYLADEEARRQAATAAADPFAV